MDEKTFFKLLVCFQCDVNFHRSEKRTPVWPLGAPDQPYSTGVAARADDGCADTALEEASVQLGGVDHAGEAAPCEICLRRR